MCPEYLFRDDTVRYRQKESTQACIKCNEREYASTIYSLMNTQTRNAAIQTLYVAIAEKYSGCCGFMKNVHAY